MKGAIKRETVIIINKKICMKKCLSCQMFYKNTIPFKVYFIIIEKIRRFRLFSSKNRRVSVKFNNVYYFSLRTKKDFDAFYTKSLKSSFLSLPEPHSGGL